MTTAIFKQDGCFFYIKINGHAGYTRNGADIVCAACSALTYTLLQCALSMQAKGQAKDVRIGNAADGLFAVEVETLADTRERFETVVDTIATGFLLLQHKYPKNVQLHVIDGTA